MAEGVTSRSACLSWASASAGAVGAGPGRQRERDGDSGEKTTPRDRALETGEESNRWRDEESEVRVDPCHSHLQASMLA